MRFLADENFDNRIIRGLLRREPSLDIVRVQDFEIAGADDDAVLAWLAEAGRVLLTHDQRTVPIYAYERISAGKAVAGAVIVPDALSVSLAIEEILLIAEASSIDEWVNQVQRLPL